MATIKLSHSHSLSHEEARQRVAELFESYRGRFGINYRWEGDTLHLNGSGFEGRAHLHPSRIDVEVKLGLMASAFKGQVESGLKSELDKRFRNDTIRQA
jgi:putative polyhydroxyalkanoate system protein